MQGAEPIYLHLIRPIIKPHTRTLDASLELLLMVGDFLIALSTYPVQLAVQWWKKRFAWFFEPPRFEDSSDESSNEVTSEVSSTFASSCQPFARGGDIQNLSTSSNRNPNENRRPYISPGNRGFSEEYLPQAFNMRSSVKHLSYSRQSSRSQTLPSADNNGEIDSSTSPSHYRIWYPPSVFYPDNGNEVDRTLRPTVSVEVREQVRILAEQQTDEWRQYPPFPSAYPPTPIATTSRLDPNAHSLSSSNYPSIPEEVNLQQDFQRSLLPPRVPLNPSGAGDSSDQHKISGIPSSSASDAGESISTDDYGNEDEDEFNVTLKTPLQLNGSTRSRPRPNLFVSPPSISAASSNFSVPSRSSPLTTVDHGSPLRTDTWSDSSLSSVAFNRLPASVAGKKRLHSRAAEDRALTIERGDYESSDLRHLSSSPHERRSITPYSRTRALERLESVSTSDAADSINIAHSSSSSEHNEDNDNCEPVAPKEKRRKVTKSVPVRSVSSRPIRNKASNIRSPPRLRTRTTAYSHQTKGSKGRRPLEVPASPVKNRSGRLKAGSGREMEGKRRNEKNKMNIGSPESSVQDATDTTEQ